MILLDSTVIVGFLDADDALHEAAVAKLKQIVGHQALAASVISYAEVMTGASLGHHRQDHFDGFFDTFVGDLLPVNRQVAARAAALRGARPSLRMPDALILATADIHERIEIAICGDGDWPKVKGLDCAVEILSARRPAG